MKAVLLVFVLKRAGKPYLVRRGTFIGYPCIVCPPNRGVRDALQDVTGKIAYVVNGLQTKVAAERYVDGGETKEFMFGGQPVVAHFVEPDHFMMVLDQNERASFDFNRTCETPDVFVRCYEGELELVPLETACVA